MSIMVELRKLPRTTIDDNRKGEHASCVFRFLCFVQDKIVAPVFMSGVNCHPLTTGHQMMLKLPVDGRYPLLIAIPALSSEALVCSQQLNFEDFIHKHFYASPTGLLHLLTRVLTESRVDVGIHVMYLG